MGHIYAIQGSERMKVSKTRHYFIVYFLQYWGQLQSDLPLSPLPVNK